MKPFIEKETVEIIWSMQPNKALGLDGFTIHFYMVCWNVTKSNLLRMIKPFQKKAKVGGNTNSTFLALALKKLTQSPSTGSDPSPSATPLTRFFPNF